ncbi:3-oxoacyl-reductase [Plectosphaerella plurivora]|uniref:3-oxoacyl-reductase n=1 Tax=Plectosphaerella plurivora TaxID=936078 RepID=A0A9P8V199_9PEZI|nr:3-oxoacyl-reductase [Plectosphaerella plurivora]
MASLLRGTAFITGAAAGIGQQTALAFARHGITRLALADVNGPALTSSTAALLHAHPAVDVLPLHLDVRSSKEVRDVIAETVRRFGRLDVAVNNAGIGGSGRPTHETDEDEFSAVVDVDLHGVWRCQREELRHMIRQEDLGPRRGRGSIINVASMFALVGPPPFLTHTAYGAAKHAVVGLTKADANTYGPLNIRINAICPGYVETPLLKAKMSQDSDSPLARGIANTPLQRLAQMEEITDCIVFMASEMSSFMQGASLVADGGYTIN